MAENAQLINEIDRCTEKIAYLRVLAYAASELTDRLGREIYAFCRQENRNDLRIAMNDITAAVFWLRDEIFNFDPSVDARSHQDMPV